MAWCAIENKKKIPQMLYSVLQNDPILAVGGRECVFYLVVGKVEWVGIEVTHGWP
jgi:hypothetical protein